MLITNLVLTPLNIPAFFLFKLFSLAHFQENVTSLVRLPLTGREFFRFSFLDQSQINTPKTPYFPHFPHQLVAMAREQQLCDSCELEYFYVMGKYHGAICAGIFSGTSDIAIKC